MPSSNFVFFHHISSRTLRALFLNTNDCSCSASLLSTWRHTDGWVGEGGKRCCEIGSVEGIVASGRLNRMRSDACVILTDEQIDSFSSLQHLIDVLDHGVLER